MRMRKTTVYLDEDSRRALKRMAHRLGRPEAELIREAVRRFTTAEGRPPATSLGIADGPGNLESRVDELLDGGFGRE
jgi:predicted transcriptional regulator